MSGTIIELRGFFFTSSSCSVFIDLKVPTASSVVPTKPTCLHSSSYLSRLLGLWRMRCCPRFLNRWEISTVMAVYQRARQQYQSVRELEATFFCGLLK